MGTDMKRLFILICTVCWLTWMIRCVENPDASQLAFQKSMGL